MQRFLDALPYNTEPAPDPPTLRTFRGVARTHTAHCLEAALSAAVILEQHGFPPLVMSLESIDGLDHVIFAYQSRGLWGSVARSRDPGLHGRRPVFGSLRALAVSYFEPYIDTTGCLRAYGAVDLRVLGGYHWRLSAGNVWKVAQLLYDIPHQPIRYSQTRVDRMRAEYYRRRRELDAGANAKWLMVNGQWSVQAFSPDPSRASASSPVPAEPASRLLRIGATTRPRGPSR